VAAEAVFRNLVLQVARAVAVIAGDAVVHAKKRVAGLLQVIELRVLPALGVVTVGALGAPLAPVHIIGLVAGDAFLGRILVAVAEMTGRAGNLGVPVMQRKGGLVVVVAHAPPGTLIVTGSAVAPELALVGLFLTVAAEAVARRLAVGLTGLVATRAGHNRVCTLERVVGVLVIELLAAEFDDVTVAPEVLGVAGAALGGLDGGQVAVEATMLPDISRSLLVTGEAQPRLATAVGAVVAVRAVVLVLGVR
jgi:hypothetical protein